MLCILKHLNWDIFSLSEHTLRMFVMNAHTGINVIKLFTPVIYNCSHQARVFVTGQPLQPSLLFVTKDGAFPIGAHKRSSTLGLTHKYRTRLERLARDKLYSLLRAFANYGCRMFYNIRPRFESLDTSYIL
jgi:hypothetical protein